jgi:hypothetical protein
MILGVDFEGKKLYDRLKAAREAQGNVNTEVQVLPSSANAGGRSARGRLAINPPELPGAANAGGRANARQRPVQPPAESPAVTPAITPAITPPVEPSNVAQNAPPVPAPSGATDPANAFLSPPAAITPKPRINMEAFYNTPSIMLPQPSKAALAFLAARGVGTAQRQVMSDPRFSDDERLGVFEERAGNAAFSGSDRRAAGRTAQGIQGRIAMREANANRLAVAERNEAAAQARGEAEATTRLAPQIASLTGKLQATEAEFGNAKKAFDDRLKAGGIDAKSISDPVEYLKVLSDYSNNIESQSGVSAEDKAMVRQQAKIIMDYMANQMAPPPAAPGGGGVKPPAPTETAQSVRMVRRNPATGKEETVMVPADKAEAARKSTNYVRG